MAARPYPATALKQRRARAEGLLPYSASWVGAGTLLGVVTAIALLANSIVASFREMFSATLAASAAPAPVYADLVSALGTALTSGVAAVAPIFAAAILAAVAASLLHVGWVFALRALFSQATVETEPPSATTRFLQSTFRAGTVALGLLAVFALLYHELPGILSFATRDASSVAHDSGRLLLASGFILAAVFAASGLADIALQRHLHQRRLRMTRAELDRETRANQMNPEVRKQRDRIHRENL